MTKKRIIRKFNRQKNHLLFKSIQNEGERKCIQEFSINFNIIFDSSSEGNVSRISLMEKIFNDKKKVEVFFNYITNFPRLLELKMQNLGIKIILN